MQNFEILEISALTGLDRNKASGDDPDNLFIPREVFNLVPNKRGAWTPLGKAKALPGAITLPSSPIGFDQGGLSSFHDSQQYKVFDGDALEESLATYADADGTAHIPKFGAYRSRTQFFGRDNADPANYFEPFTLRPTITPESTGNSSEFVADVDGDDVYGMAYGNGVWVVATNGRTGDGAATNGKLWSGSDLSALTEVHDNTPLVMMGVGFGNGRFVAVGYSTVLYSDDGTTWTAATTSFVGTGKAVAYMNGAWYAGVGSAIYRSTDGGDTWTEVTTIISGLSVEQFAINTDTNVIAAAVGGTRTSGFSSSREGHIYFTTDGTTWDRNSSAQLGDQYTAIAFGSNVWVMLTDTGKIYVAEDITAQAPVLSASDQVANTSDWFNYSTVTFRDDTFYAGGLDAAVRMSTNGVDWSIVPMNSRSDGTTPNLQAMAVDGDGVLYVAGEDGKGYIVSATVGLSAGTYRVYWVTSVTTPAGSMVVDIGSERHVLAGEASNKITVTIDDTATIISDNGSPAWLTQAFLEANVYVDIYLASVVGVTGDEETEDEADPLADTSPVYDFTLRPGGDLTEVIDAIPIGRILGSGQGVMTIAFDDANAILHHERVWGLLSRDEDLYTTADESTSVEVSAFGSGFVVGYTDIGYANLARQGNYVPLAPGESESFVGMVSTPSGLLIFFTNEVYLLSGDPALGTLESELYPAIVGADEGTRPTKLGGVAFSIWKGSIYVLDGGRAERISRPADDQSDRFVELIPEPATTSLLARTESGTIYRFVVEDNFWLLNPQAEATYMLPHPDSEGARYRIDDGTLRFVDRVLDPGELPDTPYVTYRDLDYGARTRVDATYKIEVPTLDYFTVTDRDHADWAATYEALAPRLYFKILENDDEVDDAASTSYVIGRLYEDVYVFTLPRKKRSRASDFRFDFRSMPMDATIEPQILLHFIPGASRSRRVRAS